VAPALDRTVATSLINATRFLYTGEHPIQTGVDPDTIDLRRVAVLRGRVTGSDSAPVTGAVVSVLGRPEFGQTLTRADGAYDLVTNGGGQLIVTIRKDGFLQTQRTVDVPWQDYVGVPDVVLIRPDPAATTIDLSQPGMLIARGSAVQDSAGSRRATLIFSPGTQATVETDIGTRVLGQLTIHLTEFTVGPTGPAAMPGSLPATSAYTYAVDIKVDEAMGRSVELSQPALLYVENFLGFATGTGMPVGAYDPARGVWSGIPNGIVLKILSVASGVAEIDADGDGAADTEAQLAVLGITVLERRTLAATYVAGEVLWRSPVPHFTSFDCNRPLRLPRDARFPGLRDPRAPGGEGVDDGCDADGSIVQCHNQTLGEDIPINGTSYFLHYQSDRQAGRKTENSIDIALSDDRIPASATAITLEVAIAGRTVHQSFPPTPNQHTVFTWDGKDAYGRLVQGRATASISVGYVYQPSYADPAVSGNQFGQFPPAAIDREASPIPGREDVTIFQRWKTLLGPFDALPQGLGGFTISPQHTYDLVGRTLHSGDGATRRASTLGQSETNRVFFTPRPNDRFDKLDVSVRPNGAFYVADDQLRLIVDDQGRLVAGKIGKQCDLGGGDGAPALEAGLCRVKEVAAGPDDSVYFVDSAMIRRVTPDGILHTIGGRPHTGPIFNCVLTGVGGPVSVAELCDPREMIVAGDGAIYFRDTTTSQVYKVSGDGFLSVIAGTTEGFSGDGGPALQAKLSSNLGLALGRDGSLLVVDRGNARLRRIAADGVITTIAGTGEVGDSGDGGLATNAAFQQLSQVAEASDGSIYITDTGASRYRVISAQGIISAFAGGGLASPLVGDGTPPTDVAFFNNVFIAVGPDAQVYVGENRGQLRFVYRVESALPTYALTEHVIPSVDGGEVYVFDNAGRHLRTQDATSGTVRTRFDYDAAGRLSAITDIDDKVTRVERNVAGDPIAIVAPFGQRTTLSRDQNGYLNVLTDPSGASSTMVYGSGGLLSMYTDPRGGVHAFTYDEQGRLLTDQDPGSSKKTLTRVGDAVDSTVTMATQLGRISSYRIQRPTTGQEIWTNTLTDGSKVRVERAADGAVTSSLPDGTIATQVVGPDPRFGMLSPVPVALTLRTPGGLVHSQTTSRTVSPSANGDITQVRTATETFTLNGRSFTRTYDVPNRTVTIQTPMGRKSIATLDERGRIVSLAGTSATPVQIAYDDLGHPTSLSHAERQNTFAYGDDGRVKTLANALGHSVRYDRDAVGRVLQSHWADGGADGYAFEPFGDLAMLTTPTLAAHRFERDVLGQVTAYVAPDAGANTRRTTYGYNADHQLVEVVAPDGTSANLSYDAAGRPHRVLLAEGAVDMTYDVAGRLATLSAPGNVGVTFGYDGSLATDMTWSGPVQGTVHVAYDNDFRVASERVNGEPAVVATYDDDGLATQVGKLTLARDTATGRLTQAVVGSVTESYAVNALGELTSATASCAGAPLRDVALTRNAAGAISSTVETVLGQTVTTTYDRDDLGRLISVHAGARTATYAYDRSGNRTSSARPLVVTDVYDSQDRLIHHGDIGYTYSASGQLAGRSDSSGTTSYHYDPLGSLRSIQLPGGSTLGYIIDGMGRRIGKTVDGSLIKGWLYDSELNIVAELDGSGVVVSRFVYGTRRNAPDYMTRAGVTYRILTDQVGSPRLVVNTTTCEVVQQIDYDEFGRVLADSNPGFQPFGFAGGLRDPDTGLLRFGARDYDPEIGRWTAKDPVGFQGGDSNLYAYAANDPIDFMDPTGLSFMQGLTDFSAGFGDTITFGFTRWVRRKLDVDAVVNPCSGFYKAGGVGAIVAVTVATSGIGGAAEEGAVASRGMGKLGGIFSKTTNAAGGEVWTSVGEVAQADFQSIVNSAMMQGREIKIISGVHGFADGTTAIDLGMFQFDAASLGSYEGVEVFNFAALSPSEITGLVNGSGTIIGGFCNSGACLAPFF
jgi:RHS repeat-associated protein